MSVSESTPASELIEVPAEKKPKTEKILDNSLRESDLRERIGSLVLTVWQLEKTAAVQDGYIKELEAAKE